MMPAGPLMIEYRLIERMIKSMDLEINNIAKTNKANISIFYVKYSVTPL